ncbi:MAG: two-component sensor histidine kinase [Wenzhouxiangella sp.]|nr:MAG: two-component sensor histidine kinase [Wenzhouxiangella sp.]
MVADDRIIARALHYLNVFRMLVAPIVVVVVFSPLIESVPVGYRSFLAQAAALTYFGAAVVFLVVHLRKSVVPAELASFSIATDLILIGIILHCFGSLETGLALLLLFSVGISGLLLPLRTSLLFASLLTIGLIVDNSLINGDGLAGSLSIQAALYGIAAFVIALTAHQLGRWGRRYQLLAERRGNDLANLERVNEIIIHRMRSGVVVVDEANMIRQINESARYLLGNPPLGQRDLKKIAPPVYQRLQRWRKTGKAEDEGLLLQATQVAVVPRMMDMPGLNRPATLIFLEDTSVVSRRARDLAQASLARLSASIAHEIRNPLGALSHASQLLAESEDLPPADQKLIGMILNHTARMNDIVESVLKLSRRERARIESVNLVSWTRKLVNEFRAYHRLPDEQVQLELPSAAVIVMIDPGQLTQAVWNLLQNSLKHAQTGGRPPVITIRVSPIRGQREIALDIIDDGPGIPLEKRSQVFEPFFTTHNQGSGLGLYLARQLCDANQAPLEYVQIPKAGACFRILLRRPESGESGGESSGLKYESTREKP